MSSISAIRISAKGTAEAALIFLHGLGDSGLGWSWLPTLIKKTGIIRGCDNINYVFPNAPVEPVTCNGGYRMPAWFDIYDLGNPEGPQDVEGVFKSSSILEALVKEQIEQHNVPPEKIIIGGFSQGGAISYAALATLDVKISGMIVLSGFCNTMDALKSRSKSVNFETPIFHGHGDTDPMIPNRYGKLSADFYEELGFKNVTFKSYQDLEHSTSEEELEDMITFINDTLKLR